MKASIIVPVYNEESSIDSLIKMLEERRKGKDWEIVVVDDGSGDKTSNIVRRYKSVILISHPYNKGNGAAVKTGIRNAQSENLVVLDADNQHDPGDIDKILSYLGEFDLVVGSRTGNMQSNWLRNLGNLILRKIAGFLVGMDIPDLTSGFRAFKKEKILKFIHLYPNGFSFPTTSTMAFISSGYNVKFVPVKVSLRGTGSKTKIKLLRDGLKFILLILRMITLFNPLKIFFPISFVLCMIGMIYASLYVYLIRHIPAGAVLLILSSLIIFFFGLIADQISCLRREIK